MSKNNIKNILGLGIFIGVILIGGFIFMAQSQVSQEPQDIDPPKQYCDATVSCPFGQGTCYKFEDEEKPICWKESHPCDKCASKKCEIMESNPMQVKCV